ncbi:MAG: effector binding domain-containing protein [Pseudomonadota bacterium]
MKTDHTEAFTVQGISGRVENDDPVGIGALWDKVWKSDLHETIIDKLSEDMICVYHDYQGAHLDPFVMTIGFQVSINAADIGGLNKVNVPAQLMNRFEALGPQPDTLISQWGSIWEMPLKRTYIADYDVYDSINANKVTVHVGIQG